MPNLIRILYIGVVLLVTHSTVNADPYRPSSDEEILEKLPAPALTPQQNRLAQRPLNMPLALQLAQKYLKQARRDGDPRNIGRAEAILEPWIKQPYPAPAVRLMHAIVLQSNHDFDQALIELTKVVDQEPGNTQAWLTRASLYQVRGDYARAHQDCRHLARLHKDLIAQICMTGIASLSGKAEPAYHVFEQLRTQLPANDHTTLAWIDGLLADIAERRGDIAAADRHYRTALASETPELFLLIVYADFLLDQQRAVAVLELLEPYRNTDAALLRLALAAQQLKHAHTEVYIAELNERFSASRLRGSTLHLREEARFTLSLLQDPVAALPLAVSNWAVQREPIDARLLLEAAIAAHTPMAAQPVLTWLDKYQLQDVRLQTSIAKLVK